MNQAKNVTIDHDDVITSTSVVALVSNSKPVVQPTDETIVNVSAFRKAIQKQFTGSRAVIDHIHSLGLTSDSKDDIDKLKVVFFDTWPELSYGKLGQTSQEAIKSREALYSTKGAERSAEQIKIYDATKSAWRWVKEQTDLKAPAKKREPNSGTGKSSDEKEEVSSINPLECKSFDVLAQAALDIAKLLDMITVNASQAKVISAGLITSMRDCAKALRTQVTTSREELSK